MSGLSGRRPGCLPFCNGGLHETNCPNLRIEPCAEFGEHPVGAHAEFVRAEHLGGCNPRCDGGTHWLTSTRDDMPIRALASLGAQAGMINGRPFIWQADLSDAIDAVDRAALVSPTDGASR